MAKKLFFRARAAVNKLAITIRVFTRNVIQELSRGSVSTLGLALSVFILVTDRVQPASVPTGAFSVISEGAVNAVSLSQVGIVLFVVTIVVAGVMGNKK